MIFLSIRCSMLIYKYGYVVGHMRQFCEFSVFVAKSTGSKYYNQVLFTKKTRNCLTFFISQNRLFEFLGSRSLSALFRIRNINT
jgi:hypothetical protein